MVQDCKQILEFGGSTSQQLVYFQYRLQVVGQGRVLGTREGSWTDACSRTRVPGFGPWWFKPASVEPKSLGNGGPLGFTPGTQILETRVLERRFRVPASFREPVNGCRLPGMSTQRVGLTSSDTLTSWLFIEGHRVGPLLWLRKGLSNYTSRW